MIDLLLGEAGFELVLGRIVVLVVVVVVEVAVLEDVGAVAGELAGWHTSPGAIQTHQREWERCRAVRKAMHV